MDDSEFQKLRDLLMRNEEFRQRGYEEPTENFGARLGRTYGGVNPHPRVLEQDVRRIAGQLEVAVAFVHRTGFGAPTGPDSHRLRSQRSWTTDAP
jgi:hypothetical protein